MVFSYLSPLDQSRRDGVRFNIFQWLWAVHSDCGAEIASKLGNIAIALLQQKCFSWSSYACRSVILAGNGGLPGHLRDVYASFSHLVRFVCSGGLYCANLHMPWGFKPWKFYAFVNAGGVFATLKSRSKGPSFTAQPTRKPHQQLVLGQLEIGKRPDRTGFCLMHIFYCNKAIGLQIRQPCPATPKLSKSAHHQDLAPSHRCPATACGNMQAVQHYAGTLKKRVYIQKKTFLEGEAPTQAWSHRVRV